jgi:SAM-dependent methyltransferase
MISTTNTFNRFYSDQTRDGAVAFYGWVRRETTPQTVLLNLGAGPPADRGSMRIFHGKVARVVGAEIDPEILGASDVDEVRAISSDHTVPFEDNTFDAVLCDWVLEHLSSPDEFLAEVYQVLKKGGVFLFRAPNSWLYDAIIANLTPDWFTPAAHESSPTNHRLNSHETVYAECCRAGFGRIELRTWEPEPRHLGFHFLPLLAGVGHERIVDRYRMFEGLRAGIFGRMVK